MTVLFAAASNGGDARAEHAAPPAVQERIIAVIPPDAPPTYFRDNVTGRPSGFSVDTLDAIAERAGLQVEYRFVSGWDHIIEAVREGEADIAPDLGISEERKKILAFTELLEAVPVSFFVRNTMDALNWKPEGRTIGAIDESIASEHVRTYRGVTLVTYEGFVQGLFDLLSGRIDAFAGPVPTLTRLARQAGVEDRIIVAGPLITELKRAGAVRRGNVALLNRLNKAMEGFVGGPEYQRIYAKWYGKPQPFWSLRRVILASLLIGSIMGLVIGMIMWRNRSLVRLNQDLQKALVEIKTLQGILPICAACKKIRDDKGAWHHLEAYIQSHTKAEFSHGLCAECAKKLYPKYSDKLK